MSIENNTHKTFSQRHVGPSDSEIRQMLGEVQVASLQQLIDQTVPPDIRLEQPIKLPHAQTEHDFLESFSKLMKKNKVFKSFIGLGYHNCYLPPGYSTEYPGESRVVHCLHSIPG